MTCRVVDQAEVIAKYLNGHLDPAAQDDFEVHMLECPECQDAVELFQCVREQLEASAHEIRSYQVAGRNRWWSWATVAVCCVIVVVIGIRQVRVYKHAGHQTVQQISTPKSPPEVQTAGTGSALSPSASEAQQAAGTGSGNPQVASNTRGGASAPSGKSESATPKPQMPAHTSRQAGAGPSGAQTQVSSASDKNVHSVNPYEMVGTTGKPEQSEVATAGSAGNLTPDKRTDAKPAIATNATLPSETVADKIAQLAAVRPLPYSFSGLAASQPSGGGSTRGSRSEERRVGKEC